MLTVVNAELGDADKKWGYRFGVDGIVNPKDAAELLGKCSVETVERRIRDGDIRSGKDHGRLVICKRSLTDYIAGLEK
jgi:hypothetical protein